MRHSFRYFILSIVPLAVFTSFSVSNTAQQQENSHQALNFSNLSLEISTTDKKDFVKLEPIPVTLSLSNSENSRIHPLGGLCLQIRKSTNGSWWNVEVQA